MDKRYSPYQQRKRSAARASKAAALSTTCASEPPWTQDEDERLREGVLQHGGKKWKIIAQRFSNRTPLQCNRRWNNLQSVGTVVKKPWSAHEDGEMQRLVTQYGPSKWAVIASYLPGRNGKQCRERWHNQLNPAIKKGPWTEEEDDIILDMQAKYGNCWAKITEKLPGRTDNAVKNHWHSSMKAKKKKRELSIASAVADTAAGKSKSRGSSKRASRRGKRSAKKAKTIASSLSPAPAVSPTSVEETSALAARGYNDWNALGSSCASPPARNWDEEEVLAPPAIAPVLKAEGPGLVQGDALCDAILAENEEPLFEYESDEDPSAMVFVEDESDNDVDVVAGLGVHSITPRVFDDVMSSWLAEEDSGVSDASSVISTSPSSSPSSSPSPITFASPLFSGFGLDDYRPISCAVPEHARHEFERYAGAYWDDDGVKIKSEVLDAAPSSDLVADAVKLEVSPIMHSFMRLSSSGSTVFETSSTLSALLSAEDDKMDFDGDCMASESFAGVLDAAVDMALAV